MCPQSHQQPCPLTTPKSRNVTKGNKVERVTNLKQRSRKSVPYTSITAIILYFKLATSVLTTEVANLRKESGGYTVPSILRKTEWRGYTLFPLKLRVNSVKLNQILLVMCVNGFNIHLWNIESLPVFPHVAA